MEVRNTGSDVKSSRPVPTDLSFDPEWKRFRLPDQSIEDLILPILTIDGEGTIQRVSKAARRLLEYPPSAELDPCFFAHIHGKNLYRVMQDIAHMVCCGQQQATWLLRLRTGHGRWRWYRATAHNRLQEDDNHILIRLTEI